MVGPHWPGKSPPPLEAGEVVPAGGQHGKSCPARISPVMRFRRPKSSPVCYDRLMNTNLPDILTPDQAAAYLQVDRETVYRYIRDGRLSASRLGRRLRIPRRSIDLLLLATRARPDLTIRTYTDQQLVDFLEADQTNVEARKIVDAYEARGPVTGSDE